MLGWVCLAALEHRVRFSVKARTASRVSSVAIISVILRISFSICVSSDSTAPVCISRFAAAYARVGPPASSAAANALDHQASMELVDPIQGDRADAVAHVK